jgi:hypothetical protein
MDNKYTGDEISIYGLAILISVLKCMWQYLHLILRNLKVVLFLASLVRTEELINKSVRS